jgi:hypothetical protein
MIRDIMGVPEYHSIKDNMVSISFCDDSLNKTFESIEKLGLDPSTFYQFNNYGTRSDDLTRIHNGKHVLFAGCSVTAGEGMPLDFVWSKLVYDRISREESLSGYFNIAQPGGTVIGICNQILTYIGTFGDPDVIFLNLPDLDREDRYLRSGSESDDECTRNATGLLIFGKYQQLAKMCRQRGIKLITFTWDDMSIRSEVADFRRDLDDFYQYDMDRMHRHMYDFAKKNGKHQLKDYFEYALDEAHPGVAMHDFYAEFAYNIYRSNDDNKN